MRDHLICNFPFVPSDGRAQCRLNIRAYSLGIFVDRAAIKARRIELFFFLVCVCVCVCAFVCVFVGILWRVLC